MALSPQVPIKLFLGTAVTAELRMHISRSLLWKEGNILKEDLNLPLIFPFLGKDYLGLLVENKGVTIEELNGFCRIFQDRVEYYFSEYSLKKSPLVVFPQFFLS